MHRAIQQIRKPHAVPLFEGQASHRHVRYPVWKLRLRALRELITGGRFPDCHTYVQFAGFPRSGHSIVGSVLDAHANAMVAHELDAMGLIEARAGAQEVFALIRQNTTAFQQHGRTWNGHSYAVPGGQGGNAEEAHVLGDKKGDWAVRRTMADPSLLDTFAGRFGRYRRVWILVTRNPFDNVATLSMRKGRTYDRLRIQSESQEAFEKRLREQQGKKVADTVRTDMLDDYAELCRGIAAIRQRVAAEDFLHIRHEDLIARPKAEIARLLAFLDLADADGLAAHAALIVADTPNRTRFQVTWPDDTRARVDTLIQQHDFLSGYTFDA